ncbi:MAG TPA: S-methyl-5-thioribose-1-phosphate isomerase [Thermoanaerobaculia bacterium]|jgi:methylthioribose-1-phosphate isomerase|nr:S-methyl-5-thioribose-1-phosphate isomerase [Thermoanaerobaculia bacterium]
MLRVNRDDIFSPLRWRDGALDLLEQTLLPLEETWLRCESPEQVADAIYRLAIRGAPAIGVAAAYGLVLAIAPARDEPEAEKRFAAAFELLGATRPTAVNLRWALDRGRTRFAASAGRGAEARAADLLAWAESLHADDITANLRMGEFGATLFAAGDRVLTHCNTGSLATAGYGTALGVIQSAWRQGKVSKVWVDETRPLLQGARLTTWELKRLGIPHTLATDSSAATLLSLGLVERVIVGADRIAANGDAANKIGTYPLAVLAARHGVPFYVAAPLSTIDRSLESGSGIPIEQRSASEVTEVFGTRLAPEGTEAINFAFDVTPAELIRAIVTDAGVLEAPYEASIARAFADAQ